MKHIVLILSFVVFISCKVENKEAVLSETNQEQLKPISDIDLETAIIYEANIRQYSTEGTFNEFTKDIPQLKQLGVKIIWLMPVFPISETKRKATGGDFASLIEDEAERKKMLGSYYAVSDFTKINPEFGAIDDFRRLLKTAHENGMYVILDWVPNHTGWDHTWLKTNPDFYTKNAKGEITDPLNDDGTPVGWADVADLNYDNQELRKEMLKDMLHWVTEENIDGFRCDVAGSVPTDFWEEAIPKLRAEKDIFMLAEAWEPELLKGNLFDMCYGWDTHHKMNHIAQGKETVKNWDNRMKQIDSIYETNDILMNFVTNHDENSWNGSVKERMGEASEAMLALSYCAPGMPLIYSGQEYDMDKRLLFFEKDTITKVKGKVWPLLEKLGDLKKNNIALNGGKKAAAYKKIKNDKGDVVLSFERLKNEQKIVYISNFSKQNTTVSLNYKGVFKDYISGKIIDFNKSNTIELNPWEYHVLVQ